MCNKTLACGHACSGVKGEKECLPCLHGCSPPEAKLKQDADDMCMICYTEGLSCAPCVQVWGTYKFDTAIPIAIALSSYIHTYM